MVGPGLVRNPSGVRAALDQAAGDHPVLLFAWWGHGAIVNTKGLESLGIKDDAPDPAGGRFDRDGSGRLTGLLEEYAVTLRCTFVSRRTSRSSGPSRHCGNTLTGSFVVASHGPVDGTLRSRALRPGILPKPGCPSGSGPSGGPCRTLMAWAWAHTTGSREASHGADHGLGDEVRPRRLTDRATGIPDATLSGQAGLARAAQFPQGKEPRDPGVRTRKR